MTISVRDFGLTAVCAVWAISATAQTSTTVSQQTSTQSSDDARPATSTFLGDTGLWFVPTAEVLAHGKWSASGYRRGTNYIQGFTNVGDFAGTFAVGIRDRAEIFGSFLFDTRVERDLRPIFIADRKVGGIVDRYPRANSGWSGDNLGDLYIGAKVNLRSEARQNALALAVRGIVKAPTGDEDSGASTGKADFLVDFIASKEVHSYLDLSGYAGYEIRGAPEGIDAPDGAFRWGIGAGFASRSPIRGELELTGVLPNADTATITGQVACLAIGCPTVIAGTDGSVPPLISDTETITRATAALTWQARNGFFIGGGVSWNLPTEDRDAYRTDEGAFGDFVDYQVRIGYHPGVRRYVAPPSSPPAPATAPVVPQNRPPTVQARCEPCTVEIGRSVTVTADAQDPDGDTLTYRWSAGSGTFQNPTDRQTLWTAPQQEGPVQATVTVNDGKGGTASANVTIQVVRPAPIVELIFEDVYFEFDRSTLRPDALRLLDDAVAKLHANPTRNLVVEGHTCNIGTAEYNLALGERRARSVQDYLTSRGVGSSRLEIRSYGEERPKFDNAREETRRLNRRGALVVRVQ
jgi:outer membrane protein OmpA-like peptidoglycan-associated protein